MQNEPGNPIKFSSEGEVEYVSHVGSDVSAIRAARVSTGKDLESKEFDVEKDGRLLSFLLRNGHWSPFEHSQVTFRVKAPIFIARQWMRHRSWVFNELSGRYAELPAEFWIPGEWYEQNPNRKQCAGKPIESARRQARLMDLYEDSVRDCAYTYNTLLRAGVAREQARAVLPVSTYTHFYATASLRSILHFLDLRLHPDAQTEMMDYAAKVQDIVHDLFPRTLLAWFEQKWSLDGHTLSD